MYPKIFCCLLVLLLITTACSNDETQKIQSSDITLSDFLSVPERYSELQVHFTIYDPTTEKEPVIDGGCYYDLDELIQPILSSADNPPCLLNKLAKESKFNYEIAVLEKTTQMILANTTGHFVAGENISASLSLNTENYALFLGVPLKPADLNVQNIESGFVLSWNQVAGTELYKVYIAKNIEPEIIEDNLLLETTETILEITENIDACTPYFAKIISVDAANQESSASDSISMQNCSVASFELTIPSIAEVEDELENVVVNVQAYYIDDETNNLFENNCEDSYEKIKLSESKMLCTLRHNPQEDSFTYKVHFYSPNKEILLATASNLFTTKNGNNLIDVKDLIVDYTQLTSFIGKPNKPEVNIVSEENQIELKWSAIKNVDTYRIYWNIGNPPETIDNDNFIQIEDTTNSSEINFVHNDLEEGENYYYRVIAKNVVGVESDPSDDVIGTPQRNLEYYLSQWDDWQTIHPLEQENTTNHKEKIKSYFDQNRVYTCGKKYTQFKRTINKLLITESSASKIWPGQLIQGESFQQLAIENTGNIQPIILEGEQRSSITISVNGLSTNIINPGHDTVNKGIKKLLMDGIPDENLSFSKVPYMLISPTSVLEAVHVVNNFRQDAPYTEVEIADRVVETESTPNYEIEEYLNTITVILSKEAFDVNLSEFSEANAVFNDKFSTVELNNRLNENNINPDNLPLYVSKMTYGLYLQFTISSYAQLSDIYSALKTMINLKSTDYFSDTELIDIEKAEEILKNSTIGISKHNFDITVDREIELVDKIQNGSIAEEFLNEKKLAAYKPIFYELRNLEDNTKAQIELERAIQLNRCSKDIGKQVIQIHAGDVESPPKYCHYERNSDILFKEHYFNLIVNDEFSFSIYMDPYGYEIDELFEISFQDDILIRLEANIQTAYEFYDSGMIESKFSATWSETIKNPEFGYYQLEGIGKCLYDNYMPVYGFKLWPFNKPEWSSTLETLDACFPETNAEQCTLLD